MLRLYTRYVSGCVCWCACVWVAVYVGVYAYSYLLLFNLFYMFETAVAWLYCKSKLFQAVNIKEKCIDSKDKKLLNLSHLDKNSE